MNKINELELRKFQDLFMEKYKETTGLTKFQNYEKYMTTKCMAGNYYLYLTGKSSIENLKDASNRYFEICNFVDAANFDKVKDKVVLVMRGRRKFLNMIEN